MIRSVWRSAGVIDDRHENILPATWSAAPASCTVSTAPVTTIGTMDIFIVVQGIMDYSVLESRDWFAAIPVKLSRRSPLIQLQPK